MKGKVVEALRFGLPVVTTSTGAQGIADTLEAMTVTNEPRAMANAILQLASDDKLWKKRSLDSLQLVKSLYSKDAMWNPLKDLF